LVGSFTWPTIALVVSPCANIAIGSAKKIATIRKTWNDIRNMFLTIPHASMVP
jgi:uncharacterized membrane protein